MKNFKDVPLPDNMKNCETDPRGLPVPYVVLKDSSGKFHFKVNDTEKQFKCMSEHLCHICGLKLGSDMWMLGGPGSAFDSRGCYIDGPIHRECGHYALQVCPYLAYKGYQPHLDLDKIQAQIATKLILHNPTVDMDRVPLFAFGKTSGVEYHTGGVNLICAPRKPFLALEFWNDGVQLFTHEDITSLMIGTKWEKYISVIENTYEDATDQS